MTFRAVAFLLFAVLPAFGYVGEKYDELEKRVGKAQMRWTEEGGVTVYCHVAEVPKEWAVPKWEIPDWAPPGPSRQRRSTEHKLHYQVLISVVDGVCFAEKYYPASGREVRMIVRDQLNDKGKITRDKRLPDGVTMGWTFDDGRKAFYSERDGTLIVVHPQWNDPRLLASLADEQDPKPSSLGICPGILTAPKPTPSPTHEPWRLIERPAGDGKGSSYTFPDEPWRVRERD